MNLKDMQVTIDGKPVSPDDLLQMLTDIEQRKKELRELRHEFNRHSGGVVVLSFAGGMLAGLLVGWIIAMVAL